MQVAGSDGVGIDDSEVANASGGKPGRGGGRQTARAKDDDAGAGERFLRGGCHAGDFELARVVGGVSCEYLIRGHRRMSFQCYSGRNYRLGR